MLWSAPRMPGLGDARIWLRMVPLLLALGPARAQAPPAPPPDAARGAEVAALAGCAACHTAEDGAPYAGGHGVQTPFGTFYGSNLTPDPEHGLGAWSYEDFVRAMRQGLAPDGTRYWPAFPFTSFQKMSDRDLRDLWAHLRGLPADARPDTPHDSRRGRWQLRLWRPLAFDKQGPLAADPERSPAWNRGRYLVDAVGHCGECHTPRGGIGGLKSRKALGGSRTEPEPGPNLTPHPEALGAWSESDWVTFFELGMTPDGDFVGGEMARVVTEGTAALDADDRAAMAVYLRSLPAVRPR